MNLTHADEYVANARKIAICEVKRLANEILDGGKLVRFRLIHGQWDFSRDPQSLKDHDDPNRFVDGGNAAHVYGEDGLHYFTDDEIYKILELSEFIATYDDRLKLTSEGVFIRPGGRESTVG